MSRNRSQRQNRGNKSKAKGDQTAGANARPTRNDSESPKAKGDSEDAAKRGAPVVTPQVAPPNDSPHQRSKTIFSLRKILGAVIAFMGLTGIVWLYEGFRPKPPIPVTNLTATLSETNSVIQVSWGGESRDWTELRLERQVDDGPWQELKLLEPSVRWYRDSEVEPFRKYRYQVSARNEHGASTNQSTAPLTFPRKPAGKFRVLVPLYAGTEEYLQYMDTSGVPLQTEDFSRKVSRDIIEAVKQAKTMWFKSSANRHPKFTSDSIEFYHYPEGFDKDSYRKAFELACRDSDVEVIASIGHATSTVTKKYGSLYGEKRIPLIAPLATSTHLVVDLRATSRVPATLRLPPPNKAQAALIAALLLRTDAPRAFIVKDLTNPEYSDDLASSFRGEFVRQPFVDFEASPLYDSYSNLYSRHGRIVGTLPVGGRDSHPLFFPGMPTLHVDALVIFGLTEPALETLVQFYYALMWPTYTILTDGAVDEYLLPRIHGLLFAEDGKGVNDASRGQDKTLYMTFPLRNPLPKGLELIPENLQRRFDMTHAIYVMDAVQIVLTVLRDFYISKEEPRTAKAVLIDKINDWCDQKSITEVSFTYDNTRAYELDRWGNSTNFEYHLYRATITASPDVQPAWEHAKTECPSCINSKKKG